MTTASVRQFVRDWGLLVFLVMASYWLFTMHRAGQAILGAKERLFQERESIVATRKSVDKIEKRLEINDVPDRLKRIETSITTAVAQNQDSIDQLDQKQRTMIASHTKMLQSLSQLLAVPKEVIDGTKPMPEGSVVPPNRVEIEPGKAP